MFVAASTACFPDLELPDALQRLADLEYTAAEITIGETGSLLKPKEVIDDVDRIVVMSRQVRRVTPIAYGYAVETTHPDYFDGFEAVCRVAKATKIVTVSVRAAELGAPFNEEVERLRDLVEIAKGKGVVVGLITECGRVTADPDTLNLLCKSVPGLAVTLDPSHFVYGPGKGVSYDSLVDKVCHVRLRDTSEQELQVRVGQGAVEYGRLVTQLFKAGYTRSLCVDLTVLPDVDQNAEMRKMRLLLESLL